MTLTVQDVKLCQVLGTCIPPELVVAGGMALSIIIRQELCQRASPTSKMLRGGNDGAVRVGSGHGSPSFWLPRHVDVGGRRRDGCSGRDPGLMWLPKKTVLITVQEPRKSANDDGLEAFAIAETPRH